MTIGSGLSPKSIKCRAEPEEAFSVAALQMVGFGCRGLDKSISRGRSRVAPSGCIASLPLVTIMVVYIDLGVRPGDLET